MLPKESFSSASSPVSRETKENESNPPSKGYFERYEICIQHCIWSVKVNLIASFKFEKLTVVAM